MILEALETRDRTAPHSFRGRLQQVALGILLIEVLTVPLSYGAVLPDGKLVLELLAFAVALLALGTGEHPGLGWAAMPLTAAAGLIVLGAFQAMPLPATWVQLLSPASAVLYERSNAVLHLFGRPAAAPRLSVAPRETVSALLVIAAYAALFISAAALCTTRLKRRLVVWAVIFVEVGYATAAVLTDGTEDRIHGTFVNPNHLAGYLEIGLMLAFGLVWSEVLFNSQRGAGLLQQQDRLEKRMLALGWRIMTWSVLAAGLALTRSRGGISAAALGSLIVFVLAIRVRGGEGTRRSVALKGALVVLAGIAATTLAVGRYPLLRFLASDPRDPSSDLRTTLWRVSFTAWRPFPVFGAGLGCFREAFRVAQPSDLPDLVEQAHNDFLQMLVTGGVIGAALSSFAVLSLFVLFLRAWRREPHREEQAYLLAGAGVLLTLVLHGLVEFNFSVPAIPATMAIVLGAAWAGRTTTPLLRKPRVVSDDRDP